MAITVREALQIGGLKNGEVLAGYSGLDNEITSVSVIEIPDATGWYRGNELQITALYSIADNLNAQLNLISNLSRYKCAALVICHSDVWLKNISPEVIKLADELAFPLIKVPSETAYIDIITPIVDEILQRQNRKLKMAVDIHNEMTKLILSGKSMQNLAKILYKMIRKPVILLDSNNDFMAAEKIDLSYENLEEVKKAAEKNVNYFVKHKSSMVAGIPTLNKMQYLISPIISGDNYYGVIIAELDIDETEVSPFDLIAIEHAGTAFALLSLRERNLLEMKARMQRDLLEDLIDWNFKDEASALSRAQGVGWDLVNIHLLMLINISSFQKYKLDDGQSEDELMIIKERLYEYVKNNVARNNAGIVSNRSDSVVIMLNVPDDAEDAVNRARTVSYSIIRYCDEKLELKVSAGISNYFNSINYIAQAYEEAQTALEIGKIIKGPQSCTSYANLGFYSVLKNLSDDEEMFNVAMSYREKLEKHDKENGTELTETLRCLIDHDENTMEAAEKLYLHRNTVLYRKQKIIDVLGYNPFKRPYRIIFQIAREIERLHGC